MQISIEKYRQLRKRLAPVLKKSDNDLLAQVEEVIGDAFLPTPSPTPKKRQTIEQRMQKYLIPRFNNKAI